MLSDEILYMTTYNVFSKIDWRQVSSIIAYITDENELAFPNSLRLNNGTVNWSFPRKRIVALQQTTNDRSW